MRGNGFRDGGNVFTNNTFHAKTEHKSTVSPRLLQLLACVLPPLHKSLAPSCTPLDPRSTLFTTSHPATNPPPTAHPLRPSLSPPAFPSVYDLRPKPFIVYGFASHILCYTSRPLFDLPRSPLLFALTKHKLVPRANADSGQFL